MRISDWSSDVCSSDLLAGAGLMAFAATSAHAQDASGGQTSGPGAQPIPPQDMPIQAGPGGTTTQARVRTSPTTTAPVYGNTGGLADIVVTARRRSESLQTVPVDRKSTRLNSSH